jgi:translation elongation factor EF-1alpha
MDKLAVPFICRVQVIFHMHSLDVPCDMRKLMCTMKGDGTVIKELPRAVNGGANAMVELTLSDSVVMETYAGCRALCCVVAATLLQQESLMKRCNMNEKIIINLYSKFDMT